MKPRRTPARDLHLTRPQAQLLQDLLTIDPEHQVDVAANGEEWLAVWQQLLRRRLVVSYRGGSGGMTDRGHYALELLKRRRVQPAYYRVRVCSSRLHAIDLVRAVAQLRARVCPTRRARAGTVQAVWATGSSQLVLDRRHLGAGYREAWYWVHPDVLARVREELPAEPGLVSLVAEKWHPPAATAAAPDEQGAPQHVD